jgi:hypothetical protein
MPESLRLLWDAQDEHGEVVAQITLPELEGNVPHLLGDCGSVEAGA